MHLLTYINLLRRVIRDVKSSHPFEINAIVILPDHLHAIWTLPPHDDNYSIRWNQIKGLFTQEVKGVGLALKKDKRNEYNLWQRRFWEHTIRDDVDLARHVNYIHYNPVKHGLVRRVRDWPYSSFHRYVREGTLPLDWGEGVDREGEFGE